VAIVPELNEIAYESEKEKAFKERDTGKKNVPPLFSKDCKTGEKD